MQIETPSQREMWVVDRLNLRTITKWETDCPACGVSVELPYNPVTNPTIATYCPHCNIIFRVKEAQYA